MIRSVFVGRSPRLCVDVVGEGEPVFFLHGIGGNRTNWHDNMLGLASSYQAMAWDARGYGKSEDYDGPLDYDQLAGDLLRAFDYFALDKVHLVGLSMGASIAAYFHHKHPDRLRTLTLCDTDMGFNRYSREEREQFARLRREPLLRGVRPEDIADDVAQALIGNPANTEAVRRLRASMSAIRPGSYVKAFDALVAREDDTELYSDIRVPLLLIVGALDRVTPPELVKEICTHCPGAVLRIIEGAGHLPNIETPRAFNALLIEFLNRNSQQLSGGTDFQSQKTETSIREGGKPWTTATT